MVVFVSVNVVDDDDLITAGSSMNIFKSTTSHFIKLQKWLPADDQGRLSYLPIIILFLIMITSTTTVITLYFKQTKSYIFKNWPLVGTLPHILLNLHRLHDWSTEVTKNLHTNTVYVAQSLVFTTDPKNVQYILKTNFSNFPKGIDYVDTFDFLGVGLFTVDSEAWRTHRKMANSVFSMKEFRNLIANVTKKVLEEQLIPLFMHASKEKYAAVDLQDVFKRYSFDILTCIIVGRKSESLSIGFPYNEFSEATDDALDALFYRHVMPKRLWKFLRWLNVGSERKMNKAMQILDRYVTYCISLRRQEEASSSWSSSSLLSMYMTTTTCNKFISDSVLNFLFGGRDTVPAGITWFFFLVTKHPRVEAKILEELRLVFSKKYSKTDEENNNKLLPVVFDSEDLKEMIYLHAALCESMRIYPPVPITRKSVLKEDVLPDGNILRAGTKILISIYGLGRMESIWGKDCLEFSPERWLDDNGTTTTTTTTTTTLNNEAKTKYFVFNIGPRNCVGKDVALTQIKMAAAAILFNFKVKVIEGQNFSVKPAISIQMKNGFMIQIEERVDGDVNY